MYREMVGQMMVVVAVVGAVVVTVVDVGSQVSMVIIEVVFFRLTAISFSAKLFLQMIVA